MIIGLRVSILSFFFKRSNG